MNKLKNYNWPVIFLFFLSPAMGELLCGSSPPAEYFQLFGLISLHLMYGGGAVIIRELLLKYKLGWKSAILFGIAYAILEEGVAVQSFFSPYWVDLGILAKYGRFAGVNWVWLVHLTIYHTFFSIYIPILITNNLFRGRYTPIKHKSFVTIGILYGFIIIFSAIIMPRIVKPVYFTPAIYFISSFIAIALCIRYGLKLKTPEWTNIDRKIPKPYKLTFLSMVIIIGYIALVVLMPKYNIPFVLTCIVFILWTAFWSKIILNWRNSSQWTSLHTIGIIYGVVLIFIIFAPLQEFDQTRKDNTAGMSIVGLAFLLLMEFIRRKIKSSKFL